MNEILVKNWNDTVGPDDTVYCLGDFALGLQPDGVEQFSKRLNGTKILVPGNHDFCHTYHKKSRKGADAEWRAKYAEWGWQVLSEQVLGFDIPGVAKVNLCHHPYKFIDADDDKYERWRPANDGRWLLCGHVHEKWKVWENMINVGVDVWNFKPVSVEEIGKIICSSTT